MDRNALTVIQGEARVSCRDVQRALGFSRIDPLHRLIRRHEDELRDFGEVFHFVAENPSKSGGRPIKRYLLNEHQATALCLWAETPKARSARKLVVEVFSAWRKGELEALPSPQADPFVVAAERAKTTANHLIAIGGFEDISLRATHLPIWTSGLRPPWWPNLAMRHFLTVSHRQMRLEDAVGECRARWPEDAPSVSGVQRYWAKLDRVYGHGKAA